MPCESNWDDYKVLVRKELLTQFLDNCKKKTPLVPEIYGELIKGDEEYWCINFSILKGFEEDK